MNRLFWIRHGENRANLTKEFSHRKVDYPLTPKGELQARQTDASMTRGSPATTPSPSPEARITPHSRAG